MLIYASYRTTLFLSTLGEATPSTLPLLSRLSRPRSPPLESAERLPSEVLLSSAFWDLLSWVLLPSEPLLNLLPLHSVTDPEPLPEGHALWTMPNVIITPHCSWASENIYKRVVNLLLENRQLVESGSSALNAIRS